MEEKILFIGSLEQGLKSKKVIETLKTIQPDFEVVELDKELIILCISKIREKFIKWKDEVTMLEYIKNPENVKSGLVKYDYLIRRGITNNFSIEDLTSIAGWNQEVATKSIQELFALGLIGRMKGKYYFTREIKDKIQFLNMQLESYVQDIKSVKSLIAELKKEVLVENITKEIKDDEEKQEIIRFFETNNESTKIIEEQDDEEVRLLQELELKHVKRTEKD